MTGTPKVLIIDDDQDYRTSVRALLESRGYTVIEAESGQQGLEKLVSKRPALIILDIVMKSSCEGYGIAWMIRNKEEYEEFRGVPILMTSSIDQSPDERFAMCPEAELIRPDYYLAKPLDIPRFFELVESLTGAAAAC